jgi:hypothetical protein
MTVVTARTGRGAGGDAPLGLARVANRPQDSW